MALDKIGSISLAAHFLGSHRTQFFMVAFGANVYLCESCMTFRGNLKPHGWSQASSTQVLHFAFTRIHCEAPSQFIDQIYWDDNPEVMATA
jgi:hypothetical protein